MHEPAEDQRASAAEINAGSRSGRIALPASVRAHGSAVRGDECKVQEKSGGSTSRAGVRPVKEIIEPIVPARGREREHAKKRDREPEEMQRRRIGRPPQTDRGPDDDGENADERERIVEAMRRRRGRFEPDRDDRLRASTADRVGHRIQTVGAMRRRGDDVERRVHFAVIDEEHDVARLDAGAGARRVGRDLHRHKGRHVAGHRGLALPADAVFQLRRVGLTMASDDRRHTNTTATATGGPQKQGFQWANRHQGNGKVSSKNRQPRSRIVTGDAIISFKINNLQAVANGFHVAASMRHAPANKLEAARTLLQPAHQPHRRRDSQQLSYGPFPRVAGSVRAANLASRTLP